MSRIVRLAIIAMVMIGLVGIARVLFSGASEADEWKRWTASVELSAIEEGEHQLLSWNGDPVAVRALSLAELEAAQTIAPSALPHPELVRDRVERVEIDGRTRWFAFVVPKGRSCFLERTEEGWFDPCSPGRWDVTGRTVATDLPNLAVPKYLIERGMFYLKPANLD